MRPPVSVVFVRENPQQMTGSGCCGKLEGDLPFQVARDPFARARQVRREFGTLYRALRQFFPPRQQQELVQITSVDPRNQPYLLPKLLHDVFCYRPGLLAGLQTALQWFSVPAVIVNGQVVSRRGTPPAPDELCHLVARLIDRASTAPPATPTYSSP